MDTPLPIPVAGMGSANTTQELDPSDILEVRDMAEAIARAEKIVGAPRSSARGLTDLFDTLGHAHASRDSSRRLTDDTAGPAIASPPGIPTPIPPRYVTMPSALPLPAPPSSASSASSAELQVIRVEDDAYYHPAGRIRSLADVTLDGYRPEPTLLVRAAARRRHFSWFIAAALVPILALAAIAFFMRGGAVPHDAAASPIAKAPVVAAPVVAAPVVAAPVVAAPVVAAPAAPPARDAVPVFDVKNLPSAKPRAR